MSAVQHVSTRQSPSSPIKKSTRSVPSVRGALAPKITLKGATHHRSKPSKRGTDETFEFENTKGRNEDDDDEDEDEMTTSFLQYCAMCEKQIIVPNSSILYCSESCRRRDATTPPPEPYTPLMLNSPTNPPNHMAEHFSASSIPTIPSTSKFVSRASIKEARIPPFPHEGEIDLDPTEWKPAENKDDEVTNDSIVANADHVAASVLPSSPPSPVNSVSSATSSAWKPKLPSRSGSSEAFTFLSQFHHSSDSLTSSKRRLGVRSAGSSGGVGLNHRTTPSLSFTSTTRSSSASSLSDDFEHIIRPTVVGSGTGAGFASLPTTAITRSADAAKMAETSAPAGEGTLTYEKNHVPQLTRSGAGMAGTMGTSSESAKGSLKRLLTGGNGNIVGATAVYSPSASASATVDAHTS